jgi:FkbM family methyltransferase
MRKLRLASRQREHAPESPPVASPFDPFFDLVSLVPNASVIFDVGAYVGDVATTLLNIFPDATAYAFEPHPISYEKLSGKSSHRLIPVRAAVATSTGTAALNVGPRPYTSSLLSRPSSGRRYYPVDAVLNETVDVETITLDGWAASHDAWPDVLKLDIQGTELAALRGASMCLRRSVQGILTEVQFVPLYEGATQYYDLGRFLAEFEFRLFRVYDLHYADDGQLVYGDALFTRGRR